MRRADRPRRSGLLPLSTRVVSAARRQVLAIPRGNAQAALRVDRVVVPPPEHPAASALQPSRPCPAFPPTGTPQMPPIRPFMDFIPLHPTLWGHHRGPKRLSRRKMAFEKEKNGARCETTGGGDRGLGVPQVEPADPAQWRAISAVEAGARARGPGSPGRAAISRDTPRPGSAPPEARAPGAAPQGRRGQTAAGGAAAVAEATGERGERRDLGLLGAVRSSSDCRKAPAAPLEARSYSRRSAPPGPRRAPTSRPGRGGAGRRAQGRSAAARRRARSSATARGTRGDSSTVIGRGHAPRRRGSSVSRSASPRRFEPNTARLIATPGNSTRCGAFCAYSAAETESMRPHDG